MIQVLKDFGANTCGLIGSIPISMDTDRPRHLMNHGHHAGAGNAWPQTHVVPEHSQYSVPDHSQRSVPDHSQYSVPGNSQYSEAAWHSGHTPHGHTAAGLNTEYSVDLSAVRVRPSDQDLGHHTRFPGACLTSFKDNGQAFTSNTERHAFATNPDMGRSVAPSHQVRQRESFDTNPDNRCPPREESFMTNPGGNYQVSNAGSFRLPSLESQQLSVSQYSPIETQPAPSHVTFADPATLNSYHSVAASDTVKRAPPRPRARLDILEVFSATSQRWYVGQVAQVQPCQGADILTVVFFIDAEMKQKSMHSEDLNLADLGQHTSDLPPGCVQKPSQSRPGEVVYLDATTGNKYASVELVWKMHFERMQKRSPAGMETIQPGCAPVSQSHSQQKAASLPSKAPVPPSTPSALFQQANASLTGVGAPDSAKKTTDIPAVMAAAAAAGESRPLHPAVGPSQPTSPYISSNVMVSMPIVPTPPDGLQWRN